MLDGKKYNIIYKKRKAVAGGTCSKRKSIQIVYKKRLAHLKQGSLEKSSIAEHAPNKNYNIIKVRQRNKQLQTSQLC